MIDSDSWKNFSRSTPVSSTPVNSTPVEETPVDRILETIRVDRQNLADLSRPKTRHYRSS